MGSSSFFAWQLRNFDCLYLLNIGFWGLFFIYPFLARYSFLLSKPAKLFDTIESHSKPDAGTACGHSAGWELSVELARELKWPEDKVELLKLLPDP